MIGSYVSEMQAGVSSCTCSVAALPSLHQMITKAAPTLDMLIELNVTVAWICPTRQLQTDRSIPFWEKGARWLHVPLREFHSLSDNFERKRKSLTPRNDAKHWTRMHTP